MAEDFEHGVFLSQSAKNKAVVRPLLEWLRKDGLNRRVSEFHLPVFPLTPTLKAPWHDGGSIHAVIDVESRFAV
jgi:hypothetical protein